MISCPEFRSNNFKHLSEADNSEIWILYFLDSVIFTIELCNGTENRRFVARGVYFIPIWRFCVSWRICEIKAEDLPLESSTHKILAFWKNETSPADALMNLIICFSFSDMLHSHHSHPNQTSARGHKEKKGREKYGIFKE